MAKRVPTSVILQGLLREARDEDVTLGWIIDHLRERSFGIVLLIIALVGLVPGLASIVGILLALPAIQMIRAHPGPVLPRFIATRRISRPRLARLVDRVVPVLRRMEKFVHPRWVTPFEATKQVIGFVILMLCATLLAPIPFSGVVPTLVIMLLAFAFLEEDGILLSIALVAAAISIVITIATVWGTIEVGALL